MSLKIAMIGAGSIGFTRTLIHDLLAVPELAATTFALTDINARNLEMIATLARRDIEANGLPARIEATTNRRRALEGADYVISLVRIGGLEAFATDVDIPLKYGIDQCVGDTLCAGGIMYGQRNIAAILDFCKDIREVARPGALFLNYANPMAMNTWAALQYGQVNCLGLCHGVQGAHWMVAEVIKFLVNNGRPAGSRGYKEITTQDVQIVGSGINHQTWLVRVEYDGQDWTDRLLGGFERHPVFSQTEKVRIDMLRRFGYFSTESNGHLSEYLAWYRKRPSEIKQWIDLSSWINGETGGYLRVCTEGRNWFETDYPNWLKQPAPNLAERKRSAEHGSYIIEAHETGRIYRGHFNVRNGATIPNLPADAIVEVPAYVDRLGVHVPQLEALPLGCAAVCQNSINVQRLAVEAAVHGDAQLLKQAMLLDPLVGAVCTPPEVWQLTDEMLVAQAAWLPQYKRAIGAAKKRLAQEKPLARFKTNGAARLKVKTVAEMQRNATAQRKLAQATDKAASQRESSLKRPGIKKNNA